MAVTRFDQILSVGFASITASYTTVQSPISNVWRIFKITNNTDGDMMFSANGSTDNLFVPAGGFTLYDLVVTVGTGTDIDQMPLGIGTQFYIKYISAPTRGSVYIEGLYAKGL